MQSIMHPVNAIRSFLQISIISILLSGLSPNLFAQDQPYIVLEYMKVKPGMNDKYLEAESKFWKPVHQERVKSGDILDWTLLRVQYPSSSNSEYDYVTVTIFENYDKMENSMNLNHFKTAHPSGDMDAMLEQTGNSRSLVKQVVQRGVDYMGAQQENFIPQYVRVDYMKTPEGAEGTYVDMEKNTWKKLHQVRQKAGKLDAWGLYEVIYPYGSSEAFNYTTANFYSSWKQSGMGIETEDAQAAGLTDNSEAMMKKTLDSRSLVSSELWKRVDGLR